jgi:hypothetical protein
MQQINSKSVLSEDDVQYYRNRVKILSKIIATTKSIILMFGIHDTIASEFEIVRNLKSNHDICYAKLVGAGGDDFMDTEDDKENQKINIDNFDFMSFQKYVSSIIE